MRLPLVPNLLEPLDNIGRSPPSLQAGNSLQQQQQQLWLVTRRSQLGAPHRSLSVCVLGRLRLLETKSKARSISSGARGWGRMETSVKRGFQRGSPFGYQEVSRSDPSSAGSVRQSRWRGSGLYLHNHWTSAPNCSRCSTLRPTSSMRDKTTPAILVCKRPQMKIHIEK